MWKRASPTKSIPPAMKPLSPLHGDDAAGDAGVVDARDAATDASVVNRRVKDIPPKIVIARRLLPKEKMPNHKILYATISTTHLQATNPRARKRKAASWRPNRVDRMKMRSTANIEVANGAGAS